MKCCNLRGCIALALGLPLAVSAQEAPPPTDEEISEVIVVTAQKRATALQEVPFSIAAVTNQDIKESGANSIVDIARNVPGLTVTDLGPGQSQVAIRGISAGQVVRDQPGVKESVGIYLDESPISVALFTPDLDLYDMDRIEVLRGPQGTLYGAGNDAGTVRYITAQPKVGSFGGSVDLTFNGVSDGDLGGNLRGAINVPLGENAAMRAVGYYNQIPGFIDSVYPGRNARERQRWRSHRRAPGIPLRAHGRHRDHAAHRLPEARDRRLSAHRRLQHPRQSLHHHRACGGPGQARSGHAVPRRHRR